jgi:hypothetical protein
MTISDFVSLRNEDARTARYGDEGNEDVEGLETHVVDCTLYLELLDS